MRGRTKPGTWATRPSTCSRRRRRACTRSPLRGAGSTTVQSSKKRGRTRSSTARRSCLPSSDAKRAAELRELLNRALIAYHVEDAPVMEDSAYDALYDELAAIEAEHPELVTLDSPTRRVGAPPSAKFQKVRHLSPMGSLEKVTTDEGLQKWEADIRKRLGGDEAIAYGLEPKIDGPASNLLYECGVFVPRAKRGRGVPGEDVTPDLRTQ